MWCVAPTDAGHYWTRYRVRSNLAAAGKLAVVHYDPAAGPNFAVVLLGDDRPMRVDDFEPVWRFIPPPPAPPDPLED